MYLGLNFGLVQNPKSRNAALQVNTVPLGKDCLHNVFIFCSIIYSDVIDVLYNDTFNS